MGMMNMMIGTAAADAAFSGNVLGSHFNGTVNSTTIPDDVNGGSFTSSTTANMLTNFTDYLGQSAKFGSTYLLLSADQYIEKTVPANFSISQPWQLECWFKPQSNDVFEMQLSSDSGTKYLYYGLEFMGNSGSLSTKVYMTTSGAPISSNPGSLTRDYWWHLSVGFDGTTYRFYAAGTLQYSTTTASNLTNSGLKLRIQCATNQDGDNNYYDDLILYQNKNIRTANFTPPTSAWT